ncbi:helix-turn-helix transcriptional regulator [Streptomyces sp. AC495_CC817]|uniref:helix-turn-helix domain-containing protein n=1 Tax=Streptomyces sp. AC495_CC817 TaxID=2823900 RepID=UPI001C26FADC|nr:helix-turn-helix transcriptional regulator [Streptomyces sp. AC495_CC817]
MLAELAAHDLSCAPLVLARLAHALGGDPTCIRDVVARLDPEERHGLRPLPSPLPMIAAIEVRYDSLELADDDARLLLAVTLCLEDDLEPLLAFDGRSAEEIAASGAGSHLELRAGRVRLSDPLLSVWVRSVAGAAEEGRVHGRLSEVFTARGDRVSADWHRARASLHRAPDAAPELTRIARELSEAGYSDRALLLASEAAAHAAGAARDEAALVAGASAIASGYAHEAVSWLGMLFPDGVERFRLQGLGGLLVARAHLQGSVPDVDPRLLRPRGDDLDDWSSWTRAAAFAGVLCAERGDRRGMGAWLAAFREGAARTGMEGARRDAVVSLAWLISGEPEEGRGLGSGPLTGAVLGALRAGIGGDVDDGLRLLATFDPGLGADAGTASPGFEGSPLVRAYLAVTEVLLLVWRGDLGVARERLLRAALELPISLPFAGLGVVLARRLDLAVTGEIGPIAAALTQALPSGLRIDHLVDKAVQAHLEGAFETASSYIRLWTDRGCPQHVLSVPGLDELVVVTEGQSQSRSEPADAALARRLRTWIATTPVVRWRTGSAEIAEAARSLGSPFERGRIELMLGVRARVRDELSASREHLRAALGLFEDAGASAWARATQRRLDDLEASRDGARGLVDPLVVCRTLWQALLTPRELEVAMLAVAGSSNRDIGDALNVSIRTVEVHLGRAFAKLDVRTRVELAVLAHRTGGVR